MPLVNEPAEIFLQVSIYLLFQLVVWTGSQNNIFSKTNWMYTLWFAQSLSWAVESVCDSVSLSTVVTSGALVFCNNVVVVTFSLFWHITINIWKAMNQNGITKWRTKYPLNICTWNTLNILSDRCKTRNTQKRRSKKQWYVEISISNTKNQYSMCWIRSNRTAQANKITIQIELNYQLAHQIDDEQKIVCQIFIWSAN